MRPPTKKCIVCGEEYVKTPFVGFPEWQRSKYCSRGCINKDRKPWNKGLKTPLEVRLKQSESRKKWIQLEGGTPWNKGMKGIHLSPKSEFKKGHIPWHNGTKGIKPGNHWTKEEREKIRLANLGEKSHLWKGGVTNKNHLIRTSAKYKEWREEVFKRDNWTCQICGQRGGKLNADHIKQFAFHPKLRFKLSNGRTLCVPCHKQTDTYFNRTNISKD